MPLPTIAIRKPLVPVTDLDLQGDIGRWLKLGDDVGLVLALLTALGPLGPRILQVDSNGNLQITTGGNAISHTPYLGTVSPAPGFGTGSAFNIDRVPNALNVLGSQGNLWNNIAVGAGGFSNAFDSADYPFVAVFGNVSAATNIGIQVSADDANFYTVSTINLAAAGNFGSFFTAGAEWIRLQSSAAVTITATAQAKG